MSATNSLSQLEDRNPGELLKDVLAELCPYDSSKQQSYSYGFDELLGEEGELERLIYDSTLNYLLHRLITAAIYIRKSYFETTQDEGIYWAELRSYLVEKTRIPNSAIERVLILLHRCVLEGMREPSPGAKRAVRRKAKQDNLKCYICGRDVLHDRVDVSQDTRKENSEIEHIWPRSLGGSNKQWNLAISCTRCNELKRNHIDASDFHYEHVCASTDETMQDFRTDFNWVSRIPVLARSRFRCAVDGCKNSAQVYGGLDLVRLDNKDTYHFLNVLAFCSDHAPWS